MSIEVNCPGCQVRLRVADEHVGKQARCPQCSTIYTVPGGDNETPAPVTPTSWSMKTPEGHQYGPVSRDELRQWVSEGRVSHDCLLRSDQRQEWVNADREFPELTPASQPAAGQPLSTPATAFRSSSIDGAFVRPHRGGLVLMMGLSAWFIWCPVFSVLAWIMGGSDLRDMDSGTMDSSGRALTQAGYFLGMIHCIISLFGLLFMLLAVFIAMIANL